MTENKCGYQMHIFVTSFSKPHAPVWRCFCMVQPLRQPFRPKCTNRILQMHHQNPVVPSESGVHPQNPVCTYSVNLTYITVLSFMQNNHSFVLTTTFMLCICNAALPDGFTHGDSRPRQNGRHFADDSFKYIFMNENFRNSNKISLRFLPKGPINNVPALIRIMAWRRPGAKPLSEPMIVRSVTHICVARSQWVKSMWENGFLYKQTRLEWHQSAS